MVRTTTFEGTRKTLRSCGHFMGRLRRQSCPRKAFERPSLSGSRARNVGLDGKEGDISLRLSRMSFFANCCEMDKMKRRVFVEYWCWTFAGRVLRKMQDRQLRGRSAPGQPVQLERKEWKRGHAPLLSARGQGRGRGGRWELLDFNEKVPIKQCKCGLLRPLCHLFLQELHQVAGRHVLLVSNVSFCPMA